MSFFFCFVCVSFPRKIPAKRDPTQNFAFFSFLPLQFSKVCHSRGGLRTRLGCTLVGLGCTRLGCTPCGFGFAPLLVGLSHFFCSSHFWLKPFLFKLLIVFILRLRQSWDAEDGVRFQCRGVGASCPRATLQVGSVAQADKKPQQPRQFGTTPTTGPLAPALQWSPGAATTEHRDPATPRREGPVRCFCLFQPHDSSRVAVASALMDAVQWATAPFQHAMATKTGCESLTELKPNATILLVDGMSACDMMSQKAMLQGLSNVEGGRVALPFVSMFYGAPSKCLWEDDSGTVHTVGELRGCTDTFVVLLGQHGTLQKLHSEEWREEETLLVFLDENSPRSDGGGKVQAQQASA